MKPSWKPNYEQMIPFTVRSIVDLNFMSKAAVSSNSIQNCFCAIGIIELSQMPSQAIKSKVVYRWGCFRSGYITVKVWVDQTGYVPGETILFRVYLENESQTAILGSTVSFIEVFKALLSFSSYCPDCPNFLTLLYYFV